MTNHTSSLRREEGQGMTEYIIIVALIAVAAIGVVTIFGNDIKALFTASTNALAGEAQDPATKKSSFERHTIKDFGSKQSKEQ
jgi:Flp pilus assembly pilin Flp